MNDLFVDGADSLAKRLFMKHYYLKKVERGASTDWQKGYLEACGLFAIEEEVDGYA